MDITQRYRQCQKERDKITAKPKMIKINPSLWREMHMFHPHLDMTPQYSPLRTP